MTVAAREVITAARVMHPAFSEQLQSNTVAFDWLTGFVRRERRKLMATNSEQLLSQVTITLPLISFDDGTTVNADMIHSVSALSDTLDGDVFGQECAMVPMEIIGDDGRWPAVSWVGGGINRLYLKGAADDWTRYLGLLVNYVAIPPVVTALDDDLGLPDQFLDVAIAGLAVFFAMRSGNAIVERGQMQYLMAQESDAREAALMAMVAQKMGETFRIRDLT